MTVPDPKRPNTLPWPPMLLALAAVAAIALGAIWPLPAPAWTALPGYGLIALGLGLDVWAILTMRAARTNILPHRAADLLVTWGPFRFTRNPIYLANTVLLIGLGLAGNAWFAAAALASAILVDRLAIRREERHLAIKFGNDWIDYAAQTPRWLIR